MNTVIITRHPATVEWLKEQGITGEVIAHVTSPAQIKGKTVYGNLPFHLAAKADTINAVQFSDLPEGKRGDELTLEEMRLYASLQSFTVFKN